MKSIIYVALGTALLCVSLNNASAIPLAPGGVAPAVGEPDPVGGTIVGSTGPVAWSAPTIQGTLSTTVWVGDLSNPFGPNALTFTYEINVTGFDPHAVGTISINGFSGFLTDVSFQVPPTGIAPTFVTRSIGGGDQVTFSFFTPSIPVGANSAVIVIQTDATTLNPNVAFIQNSTLASDIPSYAPVAVPDQTNLGILFIGLAGLGLAGVCFRRQATA